MHSNEKPTTSRLPKLQHRRVARKNKTVPCRMIQTQAGRSLVWQQDSGIHSLACAKCLTLRVSTGMCVCLCCVYKDECVWEKKCKCERQSWRHLFLSDSYWGNPCLAEMIWFEKFLSHQFTYTHCLHNASYDLSELYNFSTNLLRIL